MPPRREIAEERGRDADCRSRGHGVSRARAPVAAYAQGDQEQPGGGYIRRVEPREHERIVITSNVGYVPSIGLGYTDDGRGRLVKTGQQTLLTVEYDPRAAINVDGGLIVMLNRSWGVGGSYTVAMFDNLMTSTTAAVLGRDNNLEASGTRKEKTARLELTRALVRSENLDWPTGGWSFGGGIRFRY